MRASRLPMTIRGGGGIARDPSSAVKAALTPRPDQSSTHSQAGSGRSGWADGSDASVEIYCHASRIIDLLWYIFFSLTRYILFVLNAGFFIL